MGRERLDISPIGQLVAIEGPDPSTSEWVRDVAFLPDALPHNITLSTETWTAVNRATAALARLDGASRAIPSPDLLRRPTLRREAQSTSALEGTYAPFAEVLAADRNDYRNMSAELREVLNFERVAERAFDWQDDRPITLPMLSELQRTLVRGTQGELDDAGRLRETIVVVGSRGSSFADARYVPPPPGDQLRIGVENLLEWIQNPPDLPAVVQAAMVHYQFETLHPYSDGNGRIGRLVIIVQLLRAGVIREPLLVVSPWFEQRRTRYQDRLLELSCDGKWDAWVCFFAEGVAASAAESEAKVDRLGVLQDELRATVQAAGKRGAAEQVAADLVGDPFVTAPMIATNYKLSGPGATKVVRKLIELGVLEPAEFRASGGAQMYRAPAVLDVLL